MSALARIRERVAQPGAWRKVRGVGVRVGVSLALVVLLGAALVLAHSFTLPLPEALRQAPPEGLRIVDRNGQLVARLRTEGDVWRESVDSSDVGPHTFAVLIAAEDARFWSHPGVDPLAMARAGVQALFHGRIVSGASTITQQLARTCFERPRNLWGKLREMSLALRIERSLSKREILVAYLNRVHFGPRIVGMAAASDRYLGKPLGALDLGETALLLAAVRGPSVYDLERHLERAHERRDTILRRARDQELVSAGDVSLALTTPAVLRPHTPWPGAWHLTRRIAKERPAQGTVISTVDLTLQRRVEELARQRQAELEQGGASATAIVVLDSASAEVLAYVGSHDSRATRELGQNDGVSSLRQPGSALKPFLYAAAIDQLGLLPTSVLPDEPLTFRTPGGHYTPDNYDRRFRGPVPLSRALASSLNVPAVFVLERLGVARGLSAFHEFGLTSLARQPEHYGLGLALGGGEVTLLELTAAYATLARGGRYVGPQLVMGEGGATEHQAVSSRAADLVTDMLQDEQARSEMFGLHAPELLAGSPPFALKTGTSSAFRDAWAFVFDRQLTVGVWVGNFDGRPMVRTSGAVGAAPLAVEVLAEARARTNEAPRSAADARTLSQRTGATSPVWGPNPRITFPVDGARLAPRGPADAADVVVRAVHVPTGSRLLVDGQVVELRDERALVSAGVGEHRAHLIDASGAELASVTFHVVTPG